METYFFKMILLSAIFILLYYVFLEKEKNHHFKRFFLLLSVLFSLLVPLLSITYGIEVVEKSVPFFNQEIYILPNIKAEKPSVFTLENIFLGIYLLGFIALFLKFSWGIYKLFKEMKSSSKIKKDNYYIVLKENKITPYSFWNYVFLYREDFLENKIDVKILLHEQAHIAQKHSIDILFIELLLCVFWFNPSFYLYKKAMITNHEFLADDTVLQQYQDIENYQKLILRELISEKILFTHPFNLHNTKKRIIMMTTKLTKLAKLKSYLTIPISATLFFLFVEKVSAKIIIDKKDKEKVLKSTEKNSEVENVIITEFFPKIENKNLPKDTIKPKVQKAKKPVKEKIKKEISNSKSNENLIPPPPPIEKIESQTPAEFPGGMIALRQKFINNFDARKLEDSKGYIKGVIKMLVSEDGKNYNAEYEFENEEFKIAAKEALEKTLNGVEWKPGTLNGKPVASALKMPMTMNFE